MCATMAAPCGTRKPMSAARKPTLKRAFTLVGVDIPQKSETDAMGRSRRFITWASVGLMALFLGGCAALRHEPPSSEIGVLYARDAERGSPCRDSLFLALRAQPPDSLNEGQLRYLLQKDRE